MAAKDYKLAVTALTNTVWICKQSKKNPNLMTEDRVAINKSEFIGIMLEFLLGECAKNKSKDGAVQFATDGVEIVEIKFNTEHPLIKDKFRI
jgi:hypothetical protein